MTYEQTLLSDLREGPIQYADKRVVGRRMPLLRKLEIQGLIIMEPVVVDDQESYLEVRLAETTDGN